MLVVIDANVMIEDRWLDGPPFRAFDDTLSQTGHKLCVPKVALAEAVNDYAEKLEECRKKIDAQLDRARKATGRTFAAPITESHVSEAAEEYERKLRARLRELRATILDYPDISHEQVVGRALARQKPFAKDPKGRGGYRDYLIWSNVLEVASEAEEPVVFISRDVGDFCDGGSLATDLVEDLDQRGLPRDSVIWYRSLGDFTDAHVKGVLRPVESLLEELSTGRYKGTDFRPELRERLFRLLVLAPEGFSPYVNLGICGLFDLSNLRATDVRELPAGELLVTMELDAACEFSPRSEIHEAVMVGQLPFEYLAFAERESGYVHVVLSMTLNSVTGRVTSFEVKSVRPPKDRRGPITSAAPFSVTWES